MWRYLMLSADAGRVWTRYDLRSEAGITTAVNCCAVRGGRLYVGGTKFVAAKTASTGWKVRHPLATSVDWHIYDIAIGPDPSQAVAVGARRAPGAPAAKSLRPVVLTTRDGGQTWQSESLGTVKTVPMSAVWTDAGIFIGAQGKIWHGRPGGPWGSINPGLDAQQTVFDISAVRDTVWACAAGGRVFKKEGTANWQVISGPWPSSATLMGIAFRSTRQGVVVGRGLHREPYVFHTEDGGRTWVADHLPSGSWVGVRKVVPTTDPDIRFLAIADLPTVSDVHFDDRIVAPLRISVPSWPMRQLEHDKIYRPGTVPAPGD